ncbi:MAG: hypothetical protein QXE79_03970 [Candidatus Bathyarchaeia archaeon]
MYPKDASYNSPLRERVLLEKGSISSTAKEEVILLICLEGIPAFLEARNFPLRLPGENGEDLHGPGIS